MTLDAGARKTMVEALVARDDWAPVPLGPCGVRASQRSRVAEDIVLFVLESLSVVIHNHVHEIDEMVQERRSVES